MVALKAIEQLQIFDLKRTQSKEGGGMMMKSG